MLRKQKIKLIELLVIVATIIYYHYYCDYYCAAEFLRLRTLIL